MSRQTFPAVMACARFLPVLAGAILLMVAGCATLRPEPPQIELLDLRVGEMTLSHAHLIADLRVFNPNAVPVTVRDVDYALLLDGIRMASGRSLKEATIQGGETGVVTLRLSTAYLDLWQFATSRDPGEAIKYALEGAVKIGGWRILDSTFPFRREGVLDPRRLPLKQP